MKKLLFVFALVSVTFISCSEDDSTTTTDFSSELSVNGSAFIPVSPSQATTSGTYGGPDIHERAFSIKATDPQSNAEAQLNLIVVANDLNATGSLTIMDDPDATENKADGTYIVDGKYYRFAQGSTVNIEDYGNRHYKITFNANVATSVLSQENKTINGSFSGTFIEIPLVD